MGKGVCLIRTESISSRYAELTLDGTCEMLIQPYIEHSENGYPTEYRTLTMFGRRQYRLPALGRDGTLILDLTGNRRPPPGQFAI
jgi:hypothetical protein